VLRTYLACRERSRGYCLDSFLTHERRNTKEKKRINTVVKDIQNAKSNDIRFRSCTAYCNQWLGVASDQRRGSVILWIGIVNVKVVVDPHIVYRDSFTVVGSNIVRRPYSIEKDAQNVIVS
jgi:hypothetical protein